MDCGYNKGANLLGHDTKRSEAEQVDWLGRQYLVWT